MNKTVLVITFLCSIVLGVSYLYAQGTQQTPQREEIILTTYYPTPYGDYDRMRVNRISVGDTNGDGQRTAEDLPTGDGQAYFAKSAIYNPQGQTPANWPAGTAGELAFSKDEGAFYYYNGSAWVAQGGGGGASMVLYGTTQCPESLGWQKVHDGVAMSVALSIAVPNHSIAVGGGGIVCKAGESLPRNNPIIGGLMGAVWATEFDKGNTGPIPCAVCVK